METENKTTTEDTEVIYFPKKTFFVFYLGDNEFALESDDILYISGETDINPLPFVHTFIEGVLNYIGKPFTVLKPKSYAQGSKLDSSLKKLVVLFNTPDETFGIHISGMDKFYEIPQEDYVTELDEKYLEVITAEKKFLKGKIKIDKKDIPVLNPELYKRALRNSLGYK